MNRGPTPVAIVNGHPKDPRDSRKLRRQTLITLLLVKKTEYVMRFPSVVKKRCDPVETEQDRGALRP